MGDTLVTLVTAFGASLAGAAFGGLFSFWATRKSNKEVYLQTPMYHAEQLISFMARQCFNAHYLCSAILSPKIPDVHSRVKKALCHYYVLSPGSLWEENVTELDQYLTNIKINNQEECYFSMWGLMVYLDNLAKRIKDGTIDDFLASDPDLSWTENYLKVLHAKCLGLPDNVPLVTKYFTEIRKEIRRKGEAA